MKYIEEFRNSKLAKKISEAIFKKADGLGKVNIMEVCGTHTMAVGRFGIRDILPENVNLISGPGCPVCVTPKSYIDKAIALANIKNVIVVTFGDMLKVPGSDATLRNQGMNTKVKMVYSALDAVEIAKASPDKKAVFLAVGFETTSPTIAQSIRYAKNIGIKNYFIFCANKIMPPAMEFLAKDVCLNIDGFLCPAHVSAIIGAKPYERIVKKYNVPCVIGGFEPIDILLSVLMIIGQIKKGKACVENEYNRVVKPCGNQKALSLLKDVFVEVDSEWRGIGIIPKSGLVLNKRYSDFDVEKNIKMPNIKTKPDKGCLCGSVLKGIKKPEDCKMFGKTCTPEHPVGACMVSSEGACAAKFKFKSLQVYSS